MPLYDLPISQLRTYESAVATPPDFDAFWSSTLAEARGAAPSASFVAVDHGFRLFDVFDVTYGGYAGQPVKAWLILPKQRAGRLPVVVKYIGYGGGRSFPLEHLLWPAAGYAAFVMDTRGQGSAWSSGDTGDPDGAGPAAPGYMTRGIEAKEGYYYRRVLADAVRAVDVVRDHDAIDGARVAVCGASQGGGIALAVSGLAEGLVAVMPDVPFLTDFPRAIVTAQKDPYTEISRYLSVHRDMIGTALQTLAYFDTVCFVRKATAPTLFSVALMDLICPPSTVFGAFNAYAGADKSIIEYGFNDHEGGGSFQSHAQVKWLAERITL